MKLSPKSPSTRDLQRPTRLLCAALALGLAASALAAGAAEPQVGPQVLRGAEVGPPVTPFEFDGDVRSLAPLPVWHPGDPVRIVPKRSFAVEAEGEPEPQPFGEDPLLEAQRAVRAPLQPTGFTTPIVNIAGVGNTGVAPPDTVGDVGPNHYIQMTNAGAGTAVRVFDKGGTLLASFTLDSLGSGNCATGMGDPIVLYDRQADRWMLSEFSSSGNYLCVFVSKNEDPVSGGWWNYGFQCPSFPDYPKYSIWPTDANGGGGSYIVTANDGGPGVYALDRGNMLEGQAATFQRFVTAGIPNFGFQGLYAPADVDGPQDPPSGAPAIVMTKRDTENNNGPSGYAGDVLQFYEFQVDWTTTSNSTLTGPLYIDIADFDASVCGMTSWDCIPQPSTTGKLDPLREPIMHRLQYWRHDTYESLVGNFTVDVGGDLAGIRWFELRRTSGNWTVFSQGTFSPDAVYRWMGAVSADQTGNIALGYSVSDGSSVYPSLRYTGRQFDDPPGVMTQGEVTFVTGAGTQGFNRWGDYAAMGVDPADDCTFWFTSEYMTNGGGWATQIAAFRFDRCGCLQVPEAPTVAAYPAGDNRVEVTWDDNALSSIGLYRVKRSDAPGGPFSVVAELGDTSPGVGGGDPYSWVDTDVSGGSTYYYAVLADDEQACVSPLSAPASAVATGACTLAPVFAGVSGVSNAQTSQCGTVLTWGAATPRCAGQAAYSIYRSTDANFTPGPSNRIAAGVTGTTYTDRDALSYGTIYYYVVRAWDSVSNKEEANFTRLGSVSTGTVTTTSPLSENFAGAVVPALPTGWSQPFGSYWDSEVKPTRPSATAYSAPNCLRFKSYRTGDAGFSGRVQRTATVTIPASALAATFSFYMYHDTLSPRRDYVQLQASTNGGTSWTDVGAPVLRNLGSPSGWRQHTVDLISLKGQTVLLGILGVTPNGVLGMDMHLDDILVSIADSASCSTVQRPPEVSVGSTPATALTWSSPSGLGWQAAAGTVDGYELYRGQPADLPNLLDARQDACLRWSGTGTSASGLSENPAPGAFTWYLVMARNAVGLGSAGSDRSFQSSGSCP